MFSVPCVLSNASLPFLCVNILVRRHFPLDKSSLQHLAATVFFFPCNIWPQKHWGTKRTTMKSNWGFLFSKLATKFPFLLGQLCLIRVTNSLRPDSQYSTFPPAAPLLSGSESQNTSVNTSISARLVPPPEAAAAPVGSHPQFGTCWPGRWVGDSCPTALQWGCIWSTISGVDVYVCAGQSLSQWKETGVFVALD